MTERVVRALIAIVEATGYNARVEQSTAGETTVFSIIPLSRADARYLIGPKGKFAKRLRILVKDLGHIHHCDYHLDVVQPVAVSS